jgi:hypothetical protein
MKLFSVDVELYWYKERILYKTDSDEKSSYYILSLTNSHRTYIISSSEVI